MTTSTGIPAQSDRSAWDSDTYPEKHAIDLYNNAPIHHLPLGGVLGDYIYWDGSKWVAQQLILTASAIIENQVFGG